MVECNTKITLCDDTFKVCGDVGIDLNSMLITDVSQLSSLNEFKDALSTELIDVKSWKTESSYPTLRLLYERYMNSTEYCDTVSSQFDYCDMMKFSELVGTYWVDLIEQVVPSTTIWGSTYVYGNTIFDQQKFKYKKYSLFGCKLPSLEGNVVSPTSGWSSDTGVEWETLQNDEYYDTVSGSTTGNTFENAILSSSKYDPCADDEIIPNENSCQGVGIIQTNCGSEFIGRIKSYRETNDNDDGDISVTECSISVEIPDFVHTDFGDNQATAYVSGDITGPVTYSWSNGQSTQTATGLVYGETYTVTVYDLGVKGCRATASITLPN